MASQAIERAEMRAGGHGMANFPIDDEPPGWVPPLLVWLGRKIGRLDRKVDRAWQFSAALFGVAAGAQLAAAGGFVLVFNLAAGEFCASGNDCAFDLTVCLALLGGGVLWIIHGYRKTCRWFLPAEREVSAVAPRFPEVITGTPAEFGKIVAVCLICTLIAWAGVSDLLWQWSDNPPYVAWMRVPFIVAGPIAGVVSFRRWFRARREMDFLKGFRDGVAAARRGEKFGDLVPVKGGAAASATYPAAVTRRGSARSR